MDELDQNEVAETAEDEARQPSPLTSTPHYDKLRELLNNHKLPDEDRESVQAAIERYGEWVSAMDGITAEGDDKVRELIAQANSYKRFLELEVIWDSEADFLYRQRGQLKLDNSIIEEFLPRLVDPGIIPALAGKAYEAGPRTTFAAAYFVTTLATPAKGAGLQIRRKDQDFTVSRAAYLQSSFDSEFPAADTVTHKIYLAFVAAECKTNLDKTMFQEAIATAHDLKVAVPGSRYYLVCEWLDMTPISTGATDIDEVIILRGKRLASNVRSRFASSIARKEQRDWYASFLNDNPIRESPILRLVEHLRSLFQAEEPDEANVLERGYF